jgi:hypothetical protein
MKAAMEPPPPGVSPSNVPRMQPMNCERLSLFIMARLGRRMRMEAFSFSTLEEPDWLISSVSANSPTMTSTGSMPLRRSGTPKVKRVTPEIGSVPTVAIIRPITAAARPFTSEPPVIEAMTERPRMPRPK